MFQTYAATGKTYTLKINLYDGLSMPQKVVVA